MRIRCPHCKSKSIITHHTHPDGRIEEVYCDCTNPDCRARFVARLYYTETLIPPLSTLTDSLHEQLAHLDPQTRRELIAPYQTKFNF